MLDPIFPRANIASDRHLEPGHELCLEPSRERLPQSCEQEKANENEQPAAEALNQTVVASDKTRHTFELLDASRREDEGHS